MSLLPVVVDKFLDAGLDESNLGQDLISGGGPDERLWVRVPVSDVVTDMLDQNLHTAEGTPADGLAVDDAEPGLDLIDPLGSFRGEVGPYLRVGIQPLLGARG